MVDILHRVGARAPAAKVYAALATIDGLARGRRSCSACSSSSRPVPAGPHPHDVRVDDWD